MNKRKIINIAIVRAGQGAPKKSSDFSSVGSPFIRAGSLEKLLSGIDEYSLEKINEETAKKYKLKLYYPNTVVFAKSGMSATKNRIYKIKNPCYLVNHLAALEPRDNIDPNFLVLALRKNPPSRLIKDPAYPSINQKAIENHEIDIPEEKEDQIKIATLLSRAEALIAKRNESIRLLDKLLRSTFLEMFGDPKINPKQFPIRTLSDFYYSPKDGTKCGPFGSALKKNEYTPKGIPVWTMDNITVDGRFIEDIRLWISEDKYKKLISYRVQDGDIIISRAGTVGKMCVVKSNFNDAIISTNLIRLRLNPNLLPLYFVSLMSYCKGRVGRLRTGPDGSFTHMNTSILDNLTFPYPPLVLQTQFAQIVDKAESLKTKDETSLQELENLYGALTQRAFRGELDLKKIPVELEGKVVAKTIAGAPTLAIETKVIAKLLDEDIDSKQLAKRLKRIIKENFSGAFSFDELWEAFTDLYPIITSETEDYAQGKESNQYEDVKTLVFGWLAERRPLLTQFFDEKQKEILLKPNL